MCRLILWRDGDAPEDYHTGSPEFDADMIALINAAEQAIELNIETWRSAYHEGERVAYRAFHLQTQGGVHADIR
ncbi:MAG: hypothetical protein ACRYGR_02340 [Janthinobacterium lividum]